MKKNINSLAIFFTVLVLLSGCTAIHHSMREPNSRVDFVRNDFALSESVSGTATSVKILAIDWARLFHKKSGSVEGGFSSTINLASLPVIGPYLAPDQTASYALYNMMESNKGYDIIFYPQFESNIKRPIIGIGLIYKKTTVKATARLAKFK